MSNQDYNKLLKAYENVRKITDFKPLIGIVLGSGLGEFANTIENAVKIPYSDIEGFPVSTVAGHNGCFIMGYVGDVPVVCMQGRVHYYEGYSMTDVVMPARLMGLMGIKALFLTNAAGGLQSGMKAGDLMLITDQISSFVPSPLLGPNMDELGPRFCDMSEVYSRDLCDAIRRSAIKCNINMKEGVYLQFTGPSYETPAEVRMAITLGADAVGMSTAVEAMAASHMGIKCCGVSCISNPGAGLTSEKLNHEDVQAMASETGPKFMNLVRTSILEMAQIL